AAKPIRKSARTMVKAYVLDPIIIASTRDQTTCMLIVTRPDTSAHRNQNRRCPGNSLHWIGRYLWITLNARPHLCVGERGIAFDQKLGPLFRRSEERRVGKEC